MAYELSDSFLVSDAPIDGDERPDLLDREWFAEQVARRITQGGTGDSVVFGLAGPWGAGKTSVLALIRKFLNSGDISPDPWVVVEFTPWAVNNELALTEEFYNTIASALDDKSEKTAANGKKLLNLAAPILAAGVKALASGVVKSKIGEGAYQEVAVALAEAGADAAGELRFEANPFAERFEKISEFLEDLKLQVLVIVDDVDRLHRDELLAVMKAVRLLGRFKGVHYLLSYDTQTITDVLTHTDLAGGNRRRAEQYLEKIVQYPFQLPPIQEVHLADIIDERLRELIDRGGYSPSNSERYLDILLALLPLDRLTLRVIHRLFAQVDMMLALITEKNSTTKPSEEIDLLDAILVTYLRLEYQALYRQLPSWKSKVTGQQTLGSSMEDLDAHEQMMRERIEKIVDPAGTHTDETRHVRAVLRALFPDAVRPVGGLYGRVPDEAPFQIRNKLYFDRYFTFGFPAKDIRDAQVRDELIELIETGALPTQSVIKTDASNRVKQLLLRTKIREGILSALGQATDTSHCGDAALVLTRLTTEQERRQPELHAWWAAATYALWTKLQSDHGTAVTQAAVTAYLNEFEADMAAIAVHIGSPSPGTPLADATQIVWDRIHDEIVDAFFDTSTDFPDRNVLDQYQYWIEHRPLLQMNVCESIKKRAANQGGLDLIESTTRLVTVQTAHNGSARRRYLAPPSIDYLTRLVPREDWPSNQIPHALIPDIDREDFSYGSRRNLATNAIFEDMKDQHQQP
ncbi:P-loop NTPase fold protein [Rhodococcus sp. TAF43]|uniref:KAP family P-loop NTPase fold protein n=1 Tax=Rhodococcus sp. TAF43 TaxID=3237483 RepID=UPI003F97EFED